tara:strand:+ start:234 stop:647 length:414 start_codon:yes stop_codon:yes gene_type:complete
MSHEVREMIYASGGVLTFLLSIILIKYLLAGIPLTHGGEGSLIMILFKPLNESLTNALRVMLILSLFVGTIILFVLAGYPVLTALKSMSPGESLPNNDTFINASKLMLLFLNPVVMPFTPILICLAPIGLWIWKRRK